jgi:hypothetical protein
VFERAPGLSEEIGADFEANSPFEMLETLQRMESTPVTWNSVKAARSRAA